LSTARENWCAVGCWVGGLAPWEKELDSVRWLGSGSGDVLVVGGAGQPTAQRRHEPDGTGLGTFDADGAPRVDKAPIAAYQDRQFTQEAKERVSTTFIAHIRYATPVGYAQRTPTLSNSAADCSPTMALSPTCRVWTPSWASTTRWCRAILILSDSSR
jgi:hypothetical protein